jgi:hypothetical protein
MPKESQWDARPHPAPLPLEREKENQALSKFIAVAPVSAPAQLEDFTGSLDHTRGPAAP